MSTPGTLGAEVIMELCAAIEKFPPFNSPHEGKAVIEEELDELWDHIKSNTGRSAEARREAVQISAMALRYVLDLCDRTAAEETKQATPREPDPRLRWETGP